MPYCPRCQQWDHCEQDHGEAVMHCEGCKRAMVYSDCPGVTCPACAAKDAEIARLLAQLNAESDIQAAQRDEISHLRALVAVGREMADYMEGCVDTDAIVQRWRSLEGE